MLIKFTSGGRGAGGTIAAYLTDAARHGREHAAPEVVRGDMDRTRELIDSIERKWTYTHGVLSFAPEDAPTEAQQHEAMDAFERVAFAGLDPEQYDVTWVRHTHTGEHGGRVELHVVVPRVELVTGRALNIAPPGWEQTFAPLRDALNYEHGWARPDDPARARELHGVPARTHVREGLTLREGREGVHAYVTALIEAGQVTDRASLVEALEGAGLAVPRQGRDYLTVADPQTDERIRLKGRIYEKAWSYDAELDRAAAREAGHAVGGDRAADRERAEAAWREVDERVASRARFHAERFAREHHRDDAALAEGPGEAARHRAVVVGHDARELGHDRGTDGLLALALDGPRDGLGDNGRGRRRTLSDVHAGRAEVPGAARGGAAHDLPARGAGEAVRGAADLGDDDGEHERRGRRRDGHGADERGAEREATGPAWWELEEHGAAHRLRARLAGAVRELGQRLRGLAERVQEHGQRALSLVHAGWAEDRSHREAAAGLDRALGRIGHSLAAAVAANDRLGRCREQVAERADEVERVREREAERVRERTHSRSHGLTHGDDDAWDHGL